MPLLRQARLEPRAATFLRCEAIVNDPIGAALTVLVLVLVLSYSSTGHLLFIEYFNSAGSWGGRVPADCCWSHDALAYDVTDGRITTIRRLRSGDAELTVQAAHPSKR